MKTLNLTNHNRGIKMIVLMAGFIIVFGTLSIHSALGQTQNLVSVKQQGMKKLAILAGDWEGEGWFAGRDGSRSTFKQTEKIQWKLDGTVMQIEGRGIDTGQGEKRGKVIHNAMAVVTYNQDSNTYQFNSYLATGQSTVAKGEFNENGDFVWGFEANGGRIRYTITISDNQWHETGEFLRPDGQSFQFIEMTLNKVQ